MNAKDKIFQINKIPFLAIFREIFVNIHCDTNERTQLHAQGKKQPQKRERKTSQARKKNPPREQFDESATEEEKLEISNVQ